MSAYDRRWMTMVLCFVLAGGFLAAAEAPSQASFVGSFDDTTPSGAGSWTVRGSWSLHVIGVSGKADFTAALTMARSDYWVLTTGADASDPATRNAHTHHVGVENGLVSEIANGFRVTGMARVTSNGNLAFGGMVLVQVDITGGTNVETSNVKVTFGGAAAGHFGSQPINGIVSGAR